MNQLPSAKPCPKCGAAIPDGAPQGLCPACLMAAVAQPTEAGTAPPPKTPPPTREQVAAAFPQLEIFELIGAGGMGVVFKARQPKLDRLVALKLLPQHLGADAAFAGRFEREGRVLARLSHPNIVTVHDFGFAPLSTLNSELSTSPSGFYYLLMEFVDGVNLRQAMRAGRFTPVQALEVVPKICEALQFAHEQGILHRDIKPENILLDAKGRVKLVDFGIAKLVDDGRPELPPGLDAEATQQRGPTTLTSASAALGTPSYMAPEQRDHPADVDHRADIYSLGVVFYEMLTGELPVGKFAPPSAKSASDPRMDEVVLRALEQERERRQQSAGEFRTQVETVASAHEPKAVRPADQQLMMKRGQRALVAAAACILCGAAAVMQVRGGWIGLAIALTLALGLVLGGLAVFLAWPLRRQIVGKAALFTAALGLILHPLMLFWLVLPLRKTEAQIRADGLRRSMFLPGTTGLTSEATGTSHSVPPHPSMQPETRPGSLQQIEAPIRFTDQPGTAGSFTSLTPNRGEPQTAAPPVGEPLAGIGLVLAMKDGKIQVADILPRSPAQASQRLHRNDTILAIAQDGQPAVSVTGKSLKEAVNMIRGKVETSVRLTVMPADGKDGQPVEVTLTRTKLTTWIDIGDDELRSLSWHQFDQTKGQYWRALADVGRYADAAALIERYLALHPELGLDWEAINGANLHFHAAQCRAFAVQTSGALKHLALARHKASTPGGLCWNEYVDGTAAFLRRDKAALLEARDKVAAGPEINADNLAVLDRLLVNFHKPYLEAYGSMGTARPK